MTRYAAITLGEVGKSFGEFILPIIFEIFVVPLLVCLSSLF